MLPAWKELVQCMCPQPTVRHSICILPFSAPAHTSPHHPEPAHAAAPAAAPQNMKKYFSFEVQVLDDKNVRRRFRASNYQVLAMAVGAEHTPRNTLTATVQLSSTLPQPHLLSASEQQEGPTCCTGKHQEASALELALVCMTSLLSLQAHVAPHPACLRACCRARPA